MLIAVIAAVGVVVAGAVPILVGQRRLHHQVRTNHGKRPGEYLEMIADVKASVDLQGIRNEAMFRMLGEQLHDHTAQDEANFAALNQRLIDMAVDLEL